MKIQHGKLCGMRLTVLQGKFIALNAGIRKEQKYKINNLFPYLRN